MNVNRATANTKVEMHGDVPSSTRGRLATSPCISTLYFVFTVGSLTFHEKKSHKSGFHVNTMMDARTPYLLTYLLTYLPTYLLT